jgi:predicted permease
LLAFLPRQGNITLDTAFDTQVVGFTLAVMLGAGMLFGLAPALRSTRLDIVSSLKENAGGNAGKSRLALHKVLVVAQVALSLFLLIGAGLFVRSLQNLKHLDAGFDRENVMLFGLDLGSEYTPARRVTLQQQLLERLESLPGARAASLSHLALLSGGRTVNNIAVEGQAPRSDEDVKCHQLWVGPKFFTTMGIPLLQGREFNAQELQPQSGAPANATLAAVINQTMARYFFSAQNPIGQRLRFREGTLKDIPVEIIGVAKDAKYEDLREPTRRTFYLSYFQWPQEASLSAEQRILLRAVGGPSNTFTAIQRAVRELGPQIQALDLQTMNEVVDESLIQDRFLAQLGGFFSLCALLLACLGLYGVMSYAIAYRTQEIGIRIALGAQRLDVLRLALREALWLVMVGAAFGLGAALAATRMVSSLLFGLTATDPLTIAVAVLALLATALLACWIPARRATKVDPMVALRCE